MSPAARIPPAADRVDPADAVRASYDSVAERYAELFCDELRYKPLDRALLCSFTELVGPGATVADIGCGPGHVTRYLADHGLDVTGVDVSPAMVGVARRRNPDLAFEVGRVPGWRTAAGSWSAAVLLYSVIHLKPAERVAAFREVWQALRDGGRLLVGFHVGNGEQAHLDEWLGERVDLDGYFLSPDDVAAELRSCGFDLEASLSRGPYPAVETTGTARCYLLARKAAR